MEAVGWKGAEKARNAPLSQRFGLRERRGEVEERETS